MELTNAILAGKHVRPKRVGGEKRAEDGIFEEPRISHPARTHICGLTFADSHLRPSTAAVCNGTLPRGHLQGAGSAVQAGWFVLGGGLVEEFRGADLKAYRIPGRLRPGRRGLA
jgi:hypothetical protein